MAVNKEGAQVPKVLLLAHGDPESNGVCELFLRDLVSHYPAGRLVRYTMVDMPGREREGTWLGFRALTRQVQQAARPLLSTWKQFKFSRRVSEIAADAGRVVRDERIDLIWMILNSPNAICLAERMMSTCTLPFVATVWDDADYLTSSYHFDPWTTRGVLRRFAAVLSRARRVAVASEGMSELYRAKYHVDGIPLIHGIHPSLWQSPVATATTGKPTQVIGFAGSLHCKREWNAFVAAVSEWNRTEPSDIRIRFIGRFPRFGARSASFVETVGPLSLPDTLKQLATTDAAYVPFWFDRGHAWAAQTAFPSKISAYVAAGVPVLYHGPVVSSPTAFLRRYPVGLACHSLETAEIHRTLRALLFDQEVRSVAASERRRALDEQLGTEAMLRRFANFLSIDRAQLLPVVIGSGTP